MRMAGCRRESEEVILRREKAGNPMFIEWHGLATAPFTHPTLACIQWRLWQAPPMTFTVPMPASLEQAMPPARARLHFAIGAFVSEEVTLGQAAEIAGISQTELMSLLAKRRIPLHYDSGDFAEDLKTLAVLPTKSKNGHHQ